MIVLHAAPITSAASRGPNVSVPALVAAQNRLDGVEAALVLTATKPTTSCPWEFPVFDRKIAVTSDGRLDLPAPFDRPNLVVFHCPYHFTHAALAAKLRKVGIPYVICPRGGMTRFAQSFHGWKKRLGNVLFFDRMVRGAAAVNCLSRGEAAASGDWRRPTFVTGNGIELPDEADLATPGRATRLRLVFIGRLSVEYKGLDMLLEACASLRDELGERPATVELYGPDSHGSRRKLIGLIAKHGLSELVTMPGPVAGEAKRVLLRRTDVFLHTSRSEGHPMAVLEALAHGIPCLLTTATNVADDVAEAGAGFRAEPTPAGIAAALRDALAATPEELQKAGRHARQMALRHFGWPHVARRSVEQYRQWAA